MLSKKFHRHAYFHPHQLIRYLLVQTLSLNMINYNSYNYDESSLYSAFVSSPTHSLLNKEWNEEWITQFKYIN